jgi:hypothetical protein
LEQADHRRVERGLTRPCRRRQPARVLPTIPRAAPGVERSRPDPDDPRQGGFARRPPEHRQEHQEPTQPPHSPPRKPSSSRPDCAVLQLRGRPPGWRRTRRATPFANSCSSALRLPWRLLPRGGRATPCGRPRLRLRHVVAK